MSRPAKWAEYCKSLQYKEETIFGNSPKNMFVGPVIASIEPPQYVKETNFGKCPTNEDWACNGHRYNSNKPNIVTKYRMLGSPDIHAVLYDTGNIIKSVEDHKTEETLDIREKDLKGAFGYPVRGYSRQLR